MITRLQRLLFTLLLLATPVAGYGGGSALNTVVVLNQASTNSIQLANYYCEKRGIPPQHVLRINWPGDNVNWTRAELDGLLRAPLNTLLTSRGLSNQIEYVVLAMDIPYRVTNTTVNVGYNVNSTTAALFYGFKDNPANPMQFCSLAAGSSNSYAGSEGIFRQTPPISAASNAWLTFLLTSSNLTQAKLIVDRAVAGDFQMPAAPVYLARGEDRLRNIRYYLFDDAVLNTRILGAATVQRTNVANPTALGPVQGYQSGEQVFAMTATNYLPGALVDNLTSFSGFIFENWGHTDALDILNSGATASYGTIVEPCSYLQKFPSPQLYFYQSRGFSAAECYYQSVTNPYHGLLVGEPLAAPFAAPATGSWSNLPVAALLSGVTNLTAQFSRGPRGVPIQQVDLFLDGKLLHTVTNLAPRQFNNLHVTLNGNATTFTVPANATLASLATGLAAQLNTFSFSNTTKVVAFAHGDRVELQSLDLNRAGSATTLIVSNSPGSAAALTTGLQAARTDFLDHATLGLRSFAVTNSWGSNVPVGAWLHGTLIKTNGTTLNLGITNVTAGNTLRLLAREFFGQINTNPAWAAADGILVDNLNLHEDPPYDQFVYGYNDHSGEFDVVARTPGWPESQLRVRFTASAGLTFTPGTTNRLDENLNDLRPRNHLYVVAGVTNLNLTFPFNTTTNADGYHELTAVAYEGSHVRTQSHLTRLVRLQNNGWSVTLTPLVGGTNSALEAMLQFRVTANTNNITALELYSTGGLLAAATGVSNAVFSVPATTLGIGLHPFYAMATRNDGKQYRTQTIWLRIIGSEPPFPISARDTAPTLTWPATAGRVYEILSTTNLLFPFVLRDTVTPTNSIGLWRETDNAAGQRFYQLRVP